MHQFFIFTADFDPWRTHRIISACRAFITEIDPHFDAEALYADHVRLGWHFILTTDEARQRLIVFFTGLTKKVAAERPYGDPAIQGQYDAIAAL